MSNLLEKPPVSERICHYPSLVFCVLFIIVPFVSHAQATTDTIGHALIDFKITEYDFGDINQGEVVQHVFDFVNAGNIPLVIHNVLTTCGCTTPEWPHHPIMPGDSSQVLVVFNAASKIGRQNKVITIRTNASAGDYRLRISAMVLPPKKME
ncbi:MAG: DUF1573 domain-containing protein [Cyclobacteriaceae bacterium]|nr:DUF1573 domain-containing protein [Cyclobacteriaceae bacterium]